MGESGHFPSFVRPYYSTPLIVSQARGCSVWATDGSRYLDCYAGVASLPLGHCHDVVDVAAAAQAKKYGHISTLYRSKLVDDYALSLLEAADMDLAYFVNSGSEAVDLALSLARVFTGSTTVLSLSHGYHGGTYLSKSATGLDAWHFHTDPAPGIDYASTPKCFRCPHTCNPPGEIFCISDLEERMKTIANKGHRPIFIIEPVLGVGGIIVPPPHYFKALAELVKKYDAVLVVDEVQSGFGRAGDTVFAYQSLGLTPDLVALGKGIANGYPLSAVLMSENVAKANDDLLHFNTFGGHPVSVAAAREVLSIINDKSFLFSVMDKGRRFLDLLRAALQSEESVLDTRGRGLFVGIEVRDEQTARNILEQSYQNGLLIGLGGVDRNVLRIEPPLVISENDIERACSILVDVIRSL